MNLYGFILLYLVSSVCCGNTTHFRKTDDFYDPAVVKTFKKYHNILLKRWFTRNKPLDIVGRNFKVIVEEVPPYIITSKSENGTLSINGYIGDIWNILQEELKFTSTFYILNITEGKAALQNGTYDIMLNPTTLSSQDIYDIDHSMPIMSSWYKLFMRLKEGQGSSSSYILAWSRDLWLAFVGTVIVITIFMWGISSFRRFCEIEKCDNSNGLVHKLPLRDERTNQLSFSCCLLFVLGSVTQRGFGLRESPTATSLHVVAVLSLLFGLLMQTSYSAALVSRLAVLKTDQGVEKLSDISARKSHSLCIRVENFAYSALFLGKDGELAPEWKRIVNAPPCVPAPITDQDIRETICSKEAITLDSTTVMSRIMQDPLPCFITKLKNRYAVFYVPLLMRKGFPYKNLFNACLLRLHTSGLIQRLLKVWVHQTLDLPVPLNELGVTMDHVNKILWLYAVAIIISVMLLSLEIVHYNIHLEEDEDEDEQ